MKGIAPYTHITTKSTNVGDGLRRTRRIKENAVCVRRGDVGIAPYTPSPSALRAATSPKERGKNAPMQVLTGICLGSPFGGAVTAGD